LFVYFFGRFYMFCFFLLVLTKELKEELANMKTQMDELRLRVEDSERCLLLSSEEATRLVRRGNSNILGADNGQLP